MGNSDSDEEKKRKERDDAKRATREKELDKMMKGMSMAGLATDEKKDGDDENDQEDKSKKGPSVFSVDQSAITGESLAVDKCGYPQPFRDARVLTARQTSATRYTTRRTRSAARSSSS